MNKRTVSLVIVLSLLIYAVAGSSGCGAKKNSLAKIAVTPLSPVFAKGTLYQLMVTALFTDGMVVPQWTVVTWSSSDHTVATVSSTGVVSGIKPGTAVITAADMGHPGVSDSVTVSITELLSITVGPAVVSISTGTTQQFTATGIYSADTPTGWSATWPPDITTLVSWSSSSTAVATVGTILASHGLATAGSTTGTTSITATDVATGITGTAILTVIP